MHFVWSLPVHVQSTRFLLPVHLCFLLPDAQFAIISNLTSACILGFDAFYHTATLSILSLCWTLANVESGNFKFSVRLGGRGGGLAHDFIFNGSKALSFMIYEAAAASVFVVRSQLFRFWFACFVHFSSSSSSIVHNFHIFAVLLRPQWPTHTHFDFGFRSCSLFFSVCNFRFSNLPSPNSNFRQIRPPHTENTDFHSLPHVPALVRSLSNAFSLSFALATWLANAAPSFIFLTITSN